MWAGQGRWKSQMCPTGHNMPRSALCVTMFKCTSVVTKRNLENRGNCIKYWRDGVWHLSICVHQYTNTNTIKMKISHTVARKMKMKEKQRRRKVYEPKLTQEELMDSSTFKRFLTSIDNILENLEDVDFTTMGKYLIDFQKIKFFQSNLFFNDIV